MRSLAQKQQQSRRLQSKDDSLRVLVDWLLLAALAIIVVYCFVAIALECIGDLKHV